MDAHDMPEPMDEFDRMAVVRGMLDEEFEDGHTKGFEDGREFTIDEIIEAVRSEEAYTEVAGRKPGLGQLVEEVADWLEKKFK